MNLIASAVLIRNSLTSCRIETHAQPNRRNNFSKIQISCFVLGSLEKAIRTHSFLTVVPINCKSAILRTKTKGAKCVKLTAQRNSINLKSRLTTHIHGLPPEFVVS